MSKKSNIQKYVAYVLVQKIVTTLNNFCMWLQSMEQATITGGDAFTVFISVKN